MASETLTPVSRKLLLVDSGASRAVFKKDEFEADAYASALLVKAGIGTVPQISLLEKISTLTGVMSPQITWTMSHPSPIERIKAIKKLTSNWGQNDIISRN